jgi:hypothetical protein
MKASFWKLLNDYSIVIPIMQRDYVQGRTGDSKVEMIRKDFLETIKKALDNRKPLELDFIYGSIQDGKLVLLDGQQRLTTLFLLHWFFSLKEERLDNTVKARLIKFWYETRPSSTRFCEHLVKNPPAVISNLSKEIEEQAWFHLSWRNDPTIKSMLNMLKTIEELFTGNRDAYFDLLIDDERPLISFDFLDLKDFKLTDNLYIKMNARGKPLTDFENFKARFENFLAEKHPEIKNIFSQKADRQWTDMFWDDVQTEADAAFMNYIDYITEIGYYLQSDSLDKNSTELKFDVFENTENIDLLVTSLDKWVEIGSKKDECFHTLFSVNTYTPGKVALYYEGKDLNLFKRCIRKQVFGNREKLLFYGVILSLLTGNDKIVELRLLRNLLVNSTNELRDENLSSLYKVVRALFTRHTNFDEMKPFNKFQIEDERRKHDFLMKHPECTEELYHFEEHILLKGRMSSIVLDASTLEIHREIFERIFKENDYMTIHMAMLCMGDYSQTRGNKKRLFANSEATWHDIFTNSDTSKIQKCMISLFDVLRSESISEIIKKTIIDYQNKEKDWRYYFIKYPSMNCRSGFFHWFRDSGYDLAMLEKTQLNGHWRDPYLHTLHKLFGDIEEKRNIGYDKNPLRLKSVAIRCLDNGWEIKSPEDASFQFHYQKLSEKYGIKDEQLSIDSFKDRIAVMIEILKDICSWLFEVKPSSIYDK